MSTELATKEVVETSSVTTFLNDLNTTVSDLTTIDQGINSLDYELNNAISYISYPSEISDDLSDLIDGITALSDALTILELVPDVGTFVGDLKKILKPLKDGITDANKPVKKVADIVKPYKDALEKMESKVSKIGDYVNSGETAASNFKTEFYNIYKCVQKTSLVSVLEDFSKDADPYVKGANNVLNGLISTGATVSNGLADAGSILKDDVAPIGEAINTFTNDISPILAVAKDINSALNHKISVPYGIKVTGPWYEPWKDSVKVEYFTFTVQEILNGIEDIIEEVEDLLMDGVKEFLGSIFNKINSVFKDVEHYLENSIPGLNDLEGVITKFENEIETVVTPFTELSSDISSFVVKFTSFENNVRVAFRKDIGELKGSSCVQAILNA
ncbi:hypothetical protein [Aquimarina rhabdastrellae]